MKLRLITAGIAIVVCVGVLILGQFYPIAFNIALALLSAMMVGELLTAKQLHKNMFVVIPCTVLSASFTFSVAMPFSNLAPLFLFALVLVLFSFMVFMHEKISWNDISFALAGTLAISLGTASLSLMTTISREYVVFFVALPLLVPWFADSGAYFAGMLFGKHKLCPNISPKKTVEGAVGGVIVGTIMAVVSGLIFRYWIYPDSTYVNYILLLVIGAVNTLISIIGDLSFSVIKRHCGVKDYGSIMPGHGGMLDRFDSVLLTAPIAYFLCQMFTLIK